MPGQRLGSGVLDGRKFTQVVDIAVKELLGDRLCNRVAEISFIGQCSAGLPGGFLKSLKNLIEKRRFTNAFTEQLSHRCDVG